MVSQTLAEIVVLFRISPVGDKLGEVFWTNEVPLDNEPVSSYANGTAVYDVVFRVDGLVYAH